MMSVPFVGNSAHTRAAQLDKTSLFALARWLLATSGLEQKAHGAVILVCRHERNRVAGSSDNAAITTGKFVSQPRCPARSHDCCEPSSTLLDLHRGH